MPSTPRGRWPALPILLALLAVFDLRSELRLLADHFTLTALGFAIGSHPLAVAVLAATPELWRRCRR